MVRMIPNLSEADLSALKSKAESRFYRACRDTLPADWLVLFSVPWIGTTVSGRRYDGEADFIVFAPGLGMLVVEVKGGGVEYLPVEGRWYSVDGNGTRHVIKDPFRQAVAEKHAVIDILRNDASWSRVHPRRFLAGQAVFLPDIDRLDGLVGPESPREILAGRNDLTNVRSWLESVMRYWGGRSTDWTPLTAAAVTAAEKVLSGKLEARPLLSVQLEAEERVRIQLTEQQSRILRGLGSRTRASVSGGAGTGKTLLALERSIALAKSGKKILLLCYNRLLADFFKVRCQGIPGLLPMSFHQLCEWRVQLARERSGRDVLAEARAAYPARRAHDLFDVQLPYALALSSEVVDDRFDAVIVDEGQDFKEEYWLSVELLLADEQKSYLYVFYDQNQRFYTNATSMPIKDIPFLLSFNCRNTSHIHRLAYGYFDGDPTDPPPGNEGVPVDALTAPSVSAQASALYAAIVRLLNQEGVVAGQIAVLVCGQPKEAYFEQLRGRPLPKGVSWSEEAPAVAKGLRVDTVRRFKGLEADIVFLWGIDAASIADERELLYVGMSRAKSRLTIVGTADRCEQLIGGNRQNPPQ
jgi:hypothetical protein